MLPDSENKHLKMSNCLCFSGFVWVLLVFFLIKNPKKIQRPVGCIPLLNLFRSQDEAESQRCTSDERIKKRHDGKNIPEFFFTFELCEEKPLVSALGTAGFGLSDPPSSGYSVILCSVTAPGGCLALTSLQRHTR